MGNSTAANPWDVRRVRFRRTRAYRPPKSAHRSMSCPSRIVLTQAGRSFVSHSFQGSWSRRFSRWNRVGSSGTPFSAADPGGARGIGFAQSRGHARQSVGHLCRTRTYRARVSPRFGAVRFFLDADATIAELRPGHCCVAISVETR